MSTTQPPFRDVICVHGRFQPFHLGHLEYALNAYKQSKLLYVGLANPDPSSTGQDSSSEHRHFPEANPFPYFVRMEMALGSLAEAGADLSRVRVVPFPINRPEYIRFYAPPSALHVVTVYDEWSKRKLHLLEQFGMETFGVPGEITKLTSGTELRQLLRSGQSIDGLVPQFVQNYVSQNNEYVQALLSAK